MSIVLWLVLGLLFSILLNIGIFIISWHTTTGKEAFNRWKNKKLYKSGNYVNSLFVMKTGLIKEVFVKKDEKGMFTHKNNKYITNPSLLFNYKGIPTYAYREGTPDPLNVFEERFAGTMSCNELDTVMSSQSSFDFKLWWEKNKALIVIVCLVLVVLAVVNVFPSFMTMQMLRDGTYTAVTQITPLN